MKTWTRNSLSAALLLTLVSGVCLVCFQAGKDRAESTCSTMEVRILSNEEFLEEEEVKEYLFKKYGAFIGQPLDSVRLDRMEDILDAHHFVESSEVWLTGDGVLHVDVVQKNPLLHFENAGSGFYVDRSGKPFPLHATWTADVPVVNGRVQSQEWTAAVVELTGLCDVSGMKVNEHGEISLRTERGDEEILFGQPDRLEEKIGLIRLYYEKIVPEKGRYSIVNVKYKGKIFCKI